jgi:hypothetical protein
MEVVRLPGPEHCDRVVADAGGRCGLPTTDEAG